MDLTAPPPKPPAFAKTRQAAKDLAAKGVWYWVRVAVTIVIGLFISHWFEEHPTGLIQRMRLQVYDALTISGPRDQSLGRLAIVQIGDEEFWRELGGRRPTRRDYLGKLVTKACEAGAAVVAVDFDLASPFPNGEPITHPDYQSETADLANSINSVPASCHVVLPVMLNCPNPPHGECTRRPTALDSHPFKPEQVTWGYINLAGDLRQIPLRRANVVKGTLDSFSQAVAAAEMRRKLAFAEEIIRFPYGTFVSLASFHEAGVVHQAGALMADDAKTRTALEHRTVLIGAAWGAERYGSASLVDSHLTPAGYMPGVFLHANYVAALVDNRAFVPMGLAFTGTIEVVMLLIIACVFALTESWTKRWKWVVLCTLGMLAISYFFWQNLGVFLEITIPALGLIGHALLDQYLHQLKELSALRIESETLDANLEAALAERDALAKTLADMPPLATVARAGVTQTGGQKA